MAPALEQFIRQLEDSGVLAAETLKDFIPPRASPKDAEDLARELVHQKKLTNFQAGELWRGKGKSLVLGNYVLLDKIGAGGMGQVFKAQHRIMERLVAVKVLPAATTRDNAAVARFHREVKAAARLRHPNIVAADDADCANGVHFLVMEYVEGSDLSALVRRNGRFPVDQALNYILQAAKGLEFAHSEGVIHRDIKPGNLLLDKKGTVKILDMGLARIGGDAAGQAELTATGAIMGTVDYMAPEQALNTKAADARADIYSLGCSLFYLLTGRATFEGDTMMSKLLAHRDQPIPSLRAERPEVPEQVEALFCKMVAKKIEDRYQTMTAVIADLERCGGGQAIDAPLSFASTDTGLTSFLKDIAGSAPTSAVSKHVLPARSGKNNKKLLLIGGGVLGALILLAGLVISLRTGDGTLVVKVNEPDATMQVLNSEGKVEVSQKVGKSALSISVDPGKHHLQVQKEGFELFSKEFEIESGDKKSITAKLTPLEVKPAVDASKPSRKWDTPEFKKWMRGVNILPAEQQVQAVSRKLQQLNQRFDGKFGSRIENGLVTELNVGSDVVTDISPLRALLHLKKVTLYGGSHRNELTDLSPLRGMQLHELKVGWSQVTDLSPLRGMPLTLLECYGFGMSDLSPIRELALTSLTCPGTKVSDLSPIAAMRLTFLDCSGTQVSDLSPLKRMHLRELRCQQTLVTDLSPLRGMPLTRLLIFQTGVSDLSPLKGMPLTHLQCGLTKVSNLSLLKEFPLKELVCDFVPERDAEILRSIKTLEKINNKPAADFWKEVEEQQKGK